MAPRLKVFVTSDGLTDYIVAVSSRAKALAAWGVRQDLFKEGRARETDDPDLIQEASARPGEVLRKPAGTRGELARLKPARKPKATAPARPAPAPKPPPGPSRAALRKVEDLEGELAELDREHIRALAELELQRAELARRAETLQAQHEAKRARYVAALEAARRAIAQ